MTDDFGVVRTGVSYALGGDEPQEIELPTHSHRRPGRVQRQKEQSLAHLIEFESLQAKPDQLVSYFVWAEDIGPDGKPRRTMSDMYFAEVRPFEEIFRQGEQPSESEQQQQQGSKAGNQQASRRAGRAAKADHQRHLEADPPRDCGEADGRVRQRQRPREGSQQSAIDAARGNGRATGGRRVARPRRKCPVAHEAGAGAS